MTRLLILILVLGPLGALASPADEFNTAILYFEYEKAVLLVEKLPAPLLDLAMAEIAARTDRFDVAHQRLSLVDPQTLTPDLVPRYLLVRALQAHAQRGSRQSRHKDALKFLRDGLRQARTPYDRSQNLLLQLQLSENLDQDALEALCLDLAEVEGADDFVILQGLALVAASRNRRAEVASLYRTMARLCLERGHLVAHLLMASSALDFSSSPEALEERELLLQKAFQRKEAGAAYELWRGYCRQASQARLAEVTPVVLQRVLELPDSVMKLRFLDALFSLLDNDEVVRLAVQGEELAIRLGEPAIALSFYELSLSNSVVGQAWERHQELGRTRFNELPQAGLEASWYGDMRIRFGPRDPVLESWTLSRLEERLAEIQDPRERNQIFCDTFRAAYDNRDLQLLERAFLGGLEEATSASPSVRRELIGRLRHQFLGGVVNRRHRWPDESVTSEALREAILRKLAARPELLQRILDSLLEGATYEQIRRADQLSDLSWWLSAGGRIAEARELLEQAVAMPDADDDTFDALTYLLLGQGDPRGLDRLREAALNSNQGSWSATSLGLICLELGKKDEAEKWLRLAISQLALDPPRLRYNLWARRLLALTLSAQDRHQEAFAELEQAERDEAEIPEGNIYRDKGRRRRLITARVLVQAGQVAEASKLLAQSPLSSVAAISRLELDLRRELARANGDLTALDQLNAEVDAFLQRPVSLPADEDARCVLRGALLAEPLPEAPPVRPPNLDQSRLTESLERLRRREPSARDLRRLSAAEIREWMGQAGPGDVCVIPVLLNHSVVVIVLRGRGATIQEIFCDRAQFDKAMTLVQQTCSSPDSDLGRARPAFQYLAGKLIWPWLGEDTRSVSWLASGPMAQLPMAAFPDDDGRPLIERMDLTWLDGLPEGAAQSDLEEALLIGGASDLAGAETELETIRRLFPKGELWKLGEDPARLQALATSHAILHVSTHGLTPSATRLGGQLQGDGQSLSAFDLAELSLQKGSLAVVAACESAIDAATGRDNSSLVSALRTAGAARVIGSLWPLDDEVTAGLFQVFYEELRRGSTPAVSLARAQRAVARVSPHPYYWAGLQLISGP